MTDQASKLRECVFTAQPESPVPGIGAPMIVVTGGRAGVGATTVAVNLGAVLADRGERVLLVDADGGRRNMADVAGVGGRHAEHTLPDVLAGRCSVAEALVPGPAETMLLTARGRVSPKIASASRRDAATWHVSRRDEQVVLDALQAMRDDFDLIVIDLGSGITPWSRRFWLQSRLVVLVTTTDSSALMDSYATIKRSVADGIGPDVRLVLNQCADDCMADEAHGRLSNACSRFLGRSVPALPSLPPFEGDLDNAAPRVWERPDTPFGHAMLWLGRAVGDVLSTRSTELIAC